MSKEGTIHINRPDTSNGHYLNQKCPYCSEKQLFSWSEEWYGTTTICQNCKVSWQNDGEMHIRVPEFCDIKWNKPLPLFEILGIYCYNHPGRCELEIRYVKLKDNYRNQTYYVDGAGYEAESFHEWIKHEFFNWTDDFELLAKPEYAHLIHIKMMKDYMQPNKWRFEAGGYFYVD